MSSNEPDFLKALTKFAFAVTAYFAATAATVYFGTNILRWFGVTP